MNRITTFQIPVDAEELGPALFEGSVPAPLAEPLRALVAAATQRAAGDAFTIYLCADDESSNARDEFALALAKTLTAHIPSTLVIDCDFVRPGLGARVPQKDALGFLDFLLYGSSIGVITQESGGVHLVGAGSFPVTRRMPFIESAFTDASRRLATHARCAIFVGPAYDGDGGAHPLTGAVNVVSTVRTTLRNPRLDSLEEEVSSAGVEVWSLRLSGAAPEPVAIPEAAPPPQPAATRPPLDATQRVTPVAAPVADSGRGSAWVPRVALLVFAVAVVAFGVWWFLQNREPPRLAGDTETPRTTPARAAADTLRQPPVTAPARDSVAIAATEPAAGTPSGGPEDVLQRPPTNPADTAGRTGGTMLVNPNDIQVMDDLERRFQGWYMIHISSFQTSIRARDEVAFLQSREFPVFIVFLDLGAKGKWYRVYAGPFETREEAREVKKNLDAVPQVRFTRITSIPD